ncbi:MAG TPA: hypothetical protein VGZ26_00855 [Pirellulales bacterium]|jgi:hypothetical protein|nr:hypothetical protein [Pirellulales bacterium]
MMFDQIEKLKQELTDKYVIVDARVPELMRFDGHVGQVKTVNMNGRALVQFDAWSNIGWYDIDVNSLQVVPKPADSAEVKKHETKTESTPRAVAKPAATAGEKKLSPLEMARMQGAAKTSAAASKPAAEKASPAGGAAKKSTADVLAAARGAKAATPAESVAKPAAPAPKLSTADVLAAARAKKAATEKSPLSPAPAAVAPHAVAPPAVAPEPAASPSPKSTLAKPALTPGQRPSVPEILVWCRQHDAK